MQNASAPIRLLPDDLINQIAAGEVVERPTGVVKELVENAIDAGATDITIDIADAGKTCITVTDNGRGMSPDEMKLALARHATSKISSFDDLSNIHSLGFRGEALPAIASVSRMTMISRPQTSDHAYELQLEGGRPVEERAASYTIGTRIDVSTLFFNTPARLKFLKSSSTEWAHIIDYVQKAALSHPHISFTLSHNHKEMLAVSERGDSQYRLSQIFDEAFAREGLFFEAPVSPENHQLRGWLGFPSLTRKTPAGLYFFVNTRPIRDKVLQHAVTEAYQGLVMKGRFPVAILHLTLPPDEVDVNVHPTKSEIRFRDSGKLHQWVWKSVRQVLQGQPWIERPAPSEQSNPPSPPFLKGETKTPPLQKGDKEFPDPQAHEASLPLGKHFAPLPTAFGDRLPITQTPVFNWAGTAAAAAHPDQVDLPFHSPAAVFATIEPTSVAAKPSGIAYRDLSLIGQFHHTYLLCEHEDRLILVDQHAAHERIGFEALKQAFQDAALTPEPLLIPLHFDLLPSDSATLIPYLPLLETLGIDISHFGGNTFTLQSAPSLLKDANWNTLINDLVSDLRDYGRPDAVREHIDDLLASMACHRQIRAHQKLAREEMQALLDQLGTLDFAYHCPHGRPAAVEVTVTEIEKWFKRRV